MISFTTNFLVKALKNITFLKAWMKDQKFCSYLTILDHLLANQLIAAFVFEIINQRHYHVISKNELE